MISTFVFRSTANCERMPLELGNMRYVDVDIIPSFEFEIGWTVNL